MQKIIAIDDLTSLHYVFGAQDSNLKFLEKELDITVLMHPGGILLKGSKEALERATSIVKKMIELGKEGVTLSHQELSEYLSSRVLTRSPGGPQEAGGPAGEEGIRVSSSRKKVVIPKTAGQREYIAAMSAHDIVFCTGPAGTGKTYLAMAMAVNCLMERTVRRIILTRPAIEAGESLGFLPGGMLEKIGPYLRPLYDALYDMMEADIIEDHIETGVIEIVPLAYMRGRTLNDAFVILDEAQNCTGDQLRMFLTRLGFDSKTVITGDLTQSDLPSGKSSGLLEALSILKPIQGISFIGLSKSDVVRHPLIQQIIQVYENHYREKAD